MSKKDFIALADTLRASKPIDRGSHIDAAKIAQWEFMVEQLADLCAKSNPAFKRAQWLDYVAGKVGPNGGSL